jgi:lysosomal alpha-mannosidase
MLHRRCLADDGYGVGEVLDDVTHITSDLWLILDYNAENTFLHRRLALLHEHPPLALFSQPIASIQAWTTDYATQTSEVSTPLPLNVHLLSLNSLTQTNNTILRLQQIFELGEHPVYSQPAVVDISTLFEHFQTTNAVESSLSANQPLANMHRLVWNTNEPSEFTPNTPAPVSSEAVGDDVVVLTARALRTWTVSN